MNRLWVSSRWDGKRRLVRWGPYSHEVLKPRALRNYSRRDFETTDRMRFMWPDRPPDRRPVLRDKPRFQEALQLGMLVRLLNHDSVS